MNELMLFMLLMQGILDEAWQVGMEATVAAGIGIVTMVGYGAW